MRPCKALANEDDTNPIPTIQNKKYFYVAMHVELARGLIFYATGATWLSNLRKMQVTQRTGY